MRGISGLGEQSKSVKFAVVLEKAENNWAAYVPDVPGVHHNRGDAGGHRAEYPGSMAGHLKTLADFGDPVPRPTSVAKDIDVSPAA